MGLDVYYPADVRNALLAAEQASRAALAAADGDGVYTRGYQAGYRAALATIALAFGLVKPSPEHSQAPALEAALFPRSQR